MLSELEVVLAAGWELAVEVEGMSKFVVVTAAGEGSQERSGAPVLLC